MWQPRAVGALLLASVTPVIADAQVANRPTYTSIAAGVAFQDEEAGTRAHRGNGATLAMGRRYGRASVEARIATAVFDAPEQIVCPAVCGASTPKTVRAFGAGIGLRAEPRQTVLVPSALVGVGVRRVSMSHDGSEVRPYAEVGAGIGAHSGRAVLGVEATLQVGAHAGGFPGRIVVLAARLAL